MSKKQAFITDWAVIEYIDVYTASILKDKKGFPDRFFSDLSDSYPVVLFGRAVNDHRSNLITEEFADGNRIITSLICGFKNGLLTTKNTIYILGEINADYKQWCEYNKTEWYKLSNREFKIDITKYYEEVLLINFGSAIPLNSDMETPALEKKLVLDRKFVKKQIAIILDMEDRHLKRINDLPDIKFTVGDK